MRYRRALVCLKPRFLGDAVMAMPLVDQVVQRADSVVLWLSKSNQSIFEGRSPRLELQPLGKCHAVRETLAVAQMLRKQRIDVAFLVNRSARSAIVCLLARIPIRIGHNTEGRGLLLTDRVRYDRTKYEADCYLDLLRAVDASAVLTPCRIPLSEAERGLGKELIREATLGIQPGASYVGKQYPVERWVAVGKALQTAGERIAVIGGPDEQALADQCAAMIGGDVVNLAGKTSVRESVAALGALRGFLSADTGVAHLAASAGCPRVTLFGPQPATKWAHPDTHAIQAEAGEVSRIDPAQVIEAAKQMLSRRFADKT